MDLIRDALDHRINRKALGFASDYIEIRTDEKVIFKHTKRPCHSAK